MTATVDLDELRRVEALRSYGIVGTATEAAFDDLALLAARVCGAPIALITFIDADRTWIKAGLGLSPGDLPGDEAFCARTIRQGGLLVVEDALTDGRFASSPLVIGRERIRFYAGAPLLTPAGHAVGAICVLDREPRRLDRSQLDSLPALARQVMAHLQLRRSLRDRDLALQRYRELVETTHDLIWSIDLDGRFTFLSSGGPDLLGFDPDELIGVHFSTIQPPEYAEADAAALARVLAGESVFNYETVRLRRDGRRMSCSMNAIPLRDDQGHIVGVAGTVRDVTEERRVQDELRRSEELYRTLVRNFPNGAVLLFDHDLRYTLAEGKGLAVVGLSKEALEGKTLREIVPPDIAARLEIAYRAALDGMPSSMEVPFADRMYSVEITPVLDERGRVTRGMVVSQDITRQKQAQALSTAFSDVGRRLSAARTPEEAARIIVGVATELLGWDACSLDLYSPDADKVLAVLTMDTLNGVLKDVPHLFIEAEPGPVTRQVLEQGARLILRPPGGGDPTPGLTSFGDVSRRSASLMFVPIRYGTRPNGILSIQSYTHDAYDQTDLTTLQALGDYCGGALERIRIEQALRESQAQLERAEAFSLVITAHLGLDGRWLKVPQRLTDLLGYDAVELRGIRSEDLTHPDDREAWRARMRRLVDGESRSFDLETRYLRKDGGTVWVYLSCSVAQDAAGQPRYFLVYLRDLTERKSLEDQLRQAQKMEAVGQLAGGVAHDFNNLLTAIGGNAELLLAETREDDPRRIEALEIARATQRAAGLTQQLLAFSRKQVLQPKVVSLNRIIRDLTGLLRRVLGEHVELRVQLDPALGLVLADAGQIEQVITNLSVNAHDAMPQGGMLTIRTDNVGTVADAEPATEALPILGPAVALSVTDTGIGMDERTRARLFEPFFTTKELGRGTGLGLATVYGIIRQSGGQIRVRTAPNQGTTFTIFLPRVDGTEHAPDREDPARPAAGTETVLVVEDEAAVRAIAARALQARGYRVLQAAAAGEALALVAAAEEVIDLLVTDVVMPGMGGRALAERLTRDRPALRVLYISGYADEAIARYGSLTPGSSLLEKPFTGDQLAQAVRAALNAGETG